MPPEYQWEDKSTAYSDKKEAPAAAENKVQEAETRKQKRHPEWQNQNVEGVRDKGNTPVNSRKMNKELRAHGNVKQCQGRGLS